MPYFDSAQEWFTQSRLLLEARPTTTRITTKYSIPRLKKKSKRRPQQKVASKNIGCEPIARATPRPMLIAKLTIKTYDPVSGVTLKYVTNKAAEVGRLIQMMSQLGRGMAGLNMDEEVSVPAVEAPKKVLADSEMPLEKSTGKTSGGVAKKGKKGRK